MMYLYNHLHVLHIYFSCHLNKILANHYKKLPHHYLKHLLRTNCTFIGFVRLQKDYLRQRYSPDFLVHIDIEPKRLLFHLLAYLCNTLHLYLLIRQNYNNTDQKYLPNLPDHQQHKHTNSSPHLNQ